MKRAATLALVAGLLRAAPVAAQTDDPADFSRARVYVELPALDLPFNAVHGGRVPSMGQALWLSADAYEALHTGLRYVFDPYQGTWWQRAARYTVVGLVDLIGAGVPPLLAWQHEEWHRAVMSRRGIDSFDDVYKFDLLAQVTAVSHVRDEDLIALKAQHPAEQVRLSQAGIEGNQELVAALERTSFFEGSRAVHTIILPMLALQNFAYMAECDSDHGDQLTDELNAADGADVPRRDFTGLDCTGWVYDLFTPGEPYAARGVHPSGVGIDRYRKRTQLSDEGRRFLTQQKWLSLLNLLDARMWGVRRFTRGGAGSGPTYWNAALRHLPAPFGFALRADYYHRRGGVNLLASLYAYASERVMPGVDLSLLHVSLPAGWSVSPRLALWLQPAELRRASDLRAGGLAGARVALDVGQRVQPWVEIEGKSEGWVPGNVYLGGAVSVRTGLSARLF